MPPTIASRPRPAESRASTTSASSASPPSRSPRPAHSPPTSSTRAPTTGVNDTVARLWFFLGAGVLGGTLLALLAGLAVADRAMRPIKALTGLARQITSTRDPSKRIPVAGDRRRGRRAGAHDGRHAPGARRGPLRARAVARAPARVRRRRLARAPDTADEHPREPRAAAGWRPRLRGRPARGRLGPLLDQADVGARLRPAAAGPCRRRPPGGAHGHATWRPVAAGALEEVQPLAGGPSAREPARGTAAPAGQPGRAPPTWCATCSRTRSGTRRSGPRSSSPPAATATRLCSRSSTTARESRTEMEDQVFDRFVRGDGPADTAGGGGSGLGLAIVRAVAESHGGSVSAGQEHLRRCPLLGAPAARAGPTAAKADRAARPRVALANVQERLLDSPLDETPRRGAKPHTPRRDPLRPAQHHVWPKRRPRWSPLPRPPGAFYMPAAARAASRSKR